MKQLENTLLKFKEQVEKFHSANLPLFKILQKPELLESIRKLELQIDR
ncbi:hypothetical protein [Spiroplasma endosymbiont of Nebria brevicollis]